MRILLSIATFVLTASPAFARVSDFATIPEPSVLSLVGIGAAAYLIARRGKK